MEMIKTAVVGLGYWGPNLVRNFFACQHTEVWAVCDLDIHRLHAIVSHYPGIKVATTSYEEVLGSEAELICIATPPETHYQLAKQALEAGKHVLVEKPFVTRVEEGEHLLALAQRKGLKVLVDHTFVFHPVVQKIKEVIESGQMGSIYYFDSERVNLGLLQRAVDVVWDLAVHDISILLYLFPEEEFRVHAVACSRHIHPYMSDFAHITLTSKSDLIAHIHVSWLSPVKIRKTIIGGSKKMLWWDDVHPFERLRIYDTRIEMDNLGQPEDPFHPRYIKGNVEIPFIPNREALAIEVEHVARVLLGEEEPISDGTLGLKVVCLLEEISAITSQQGLAPHKQSIAHTK